MVTIVLYFGKEGWDYPKNLIECFEPPLAEDEITEVLKEYIQDYRVHVFDIPRLTKEQVRLFRSDFRIVADYYTNVYNTNEYVPDNAVITHVDEFLKLMKVLTGDNRFEEIAHTITEAEKEELRMCRILDEREARGEARGFERGLTEGREQGIEQGLEQGKVNTLVFLVKDGIISTEIAVEKSGMTKEEFEKLL